MSARTIINSKFPIPNRGGFGSAGVVVFDLLVISTALSQGQENHQSWLSYCRIQARCVTRPRRSAQKTSVGDLHLNLSL
jgi:hypothetical protein